MFRLKGYPTEKTQPDLGIGYLPLAPTASERHGAELPAGALVTTVDSGGPSDRAGIRAGDIIVSLNGVRIGKEASLMEVIRHCYTKNRIALELWRDSLRTTEVVLR
ncbi:MAG: PDZ domain-containing protein [Chloroflexi bacterium]|nr:PDZ domain-containing protein [Chloroflexota bacterium]